MTDPALVREKWDMLAFLASDSRGLQGWGADVFSRVKRLVGEKGNQEFTLREFNRRFIDELSTLHPRIGTSVQRSDSRCRSFETDGY